jgi:hypothetical protein
MVVTRRNPLRGANKSRAHDGCGILTRFGASIAAWAILVAVVGSGCSVTIEDKDCEYVPPKYSGTQALSTGHWRCAP